MFYDTAPVQNEVKLLDNAQPESSLSTETSGALFNQGLNQSAPWNVVAGEGGADLGKLMEHYAKKDRELEESRRARMKEGKKGCDSLR